jgi:hypothetical protein
METGKVQRQTEHQVRIELVGVTEGFDTQYGSAYQIRPIWLTLRWSFDPVGGWKLTMARIRGPVLRKDGSDGQRSGTRDFEREGALDETAPEWVRELAALYRPSGVVLVP